MIYLLINSTDKETANQYVCDNIDLGSTDTFTENFKGKCLISLPDDGSDYTEKMKTKFGYTEELPELQEL